MKFTLKVVAVLCLLALAKAAEQSKAEPAFARTWKKLHRGPPKQIVHSRATILTEWITQKVDHFDESNNRTYEMRYMVNDEYFEEGGPMFIYLGGEWVISAGMISSGIFVDLAKEHKGVLFYTEHRYYGQSEPTSDISVENLQYLDAKQALADLAHFIRTKRESNPALANSKVIMAGCSYSASLVVWFKKLYPELLDGGWASSAPILAKVDFKEYKEVVGDVMRELGSDQCYNRIQNGIAELESMFAGTRAAEAKAMLNLCDGFDHLKDLDIYNLFNAFANIFSLIVQSPANGNATYYCDYLMGFKDDLAAMTAIWLDDFGYSTECTDATYQSTVDFINGYGRPWYYQTCNEFGWYQSSASTKQPFGNKIPASLYITMCGDVFGSKYSSEYIHHVVDETNKDFGGMSPNVENVYMTNGAMDPWSPLSHGELQGASVIPGASHCADFGSISDDNSPEMRSSKERLGKLVREWLA